jgi:predicted dehydrogenase
VDNIYKDKKILCIGPSHSGVEDLKSVDLEEYDLIVRYHAHWKSNPDCRLDVVCNSLGGAQYNKDDLEFFKEKGIVFLSTHDIEKEIRNKRVRKFIQINEQIKIDYDYVPSNIIRQVKKKLRSKPNSGVLSIFYFLEMGCSEVHAVGFDFYRTGYKHREVLSENFKRYVNKRKGHNLDVQLMNFRREIKKHSNFKALGFMKEVLENEEKYAEIPIIKNYADNIYKDKKILCIGSSHSVLEDLKHVDFDEYDLIVKYDSHWKSNLDERVDVVCSHYAKNQFSKEDLEYMRDSKIHFLFRYDLVASGTKAAIRFLEDARQVEGFQYEYVPIEHSSKCQMKLGSKPPTGFLSMFYFLDKECSEVHAVGFDFNRNEKKTKFKHKKCNIDTQLMNFRREIKKYSNFKALGFMKEVLENEDKYNCISPDYKMKVGIIGYGKMGKIRKQTIEDLYPNSDFFIHDPKQGYDELTVDEVMDKSEFVFICTPNRFNVPLTLKAIEKDKHIFCEKPPAKSYQELLEVSKAYRNSKALMYGFNHRQYDSIKKIKSIIDDKQFGDIVWMRGRYGKKLQESFFEGWRSNQEDSGGGILLDQGIHMLDLMMHFAGGFDEVQSIITNSFFDIGGIEDNAFLNLYNSEKNISASLHSTMIEWRHIFSLEILFKKGYVALNGLKTPSLSYGKEVLTIGSDKHEDANEYTRIEFSENNSWNNEIRNFFENAMGNRNVSNIKEALEVMKLIELAYENRKTK